MTRRLASLRWLLLAAVGLTAVGLTAVGVWRIATVRDESPILAAEFSPPLSGEPWFAGSGGPLHPFYKSRLTIVDAVEEYSNLTYHRLEGRSSDWFNALDVPLHGFLTRLKLRRGVERLSRIDLPEGFLEFPKRHSDEKPLIEAKPFAAELSLAPPAAGMSVASLMSRKSDELYVPPAGYVAMTRSGRILQLWTALRDRGVELKPVEGHRLKVVWHRRLKDGTTPGKP